MDSTKRMDLWAAGRMKIAVYGLWHLGTVTAACLANRGFNVVGIDDDASVIANLQQGKPPIFEPGLENLVATSRFTTDKNQAADADILWITFDTPVDEDDHADVDFVMHKIQSILPFAKKNAVILISSQLPVGSTSQVQRICDTRYAHQNISVAYSPENLRLGKAIEVFNNPERIIVGVSSERARLVLEPLLSAYTDTILWMKVESAEMVKHSLNAFLATCVTFINEVASICEEVGADAAEVERGLKSEPRIGEKAYVRPGGAFAGGTLARDVQFLCQIAQQRTLDVPLLQGIVPSNKIHQQWIQKRLQKIYPNLQGKKVAILGLAYKAGTDTLRRSHAVELCRWLKSQGVHVAAFDPHIKGLPADIANDVDLQSRIEDTCYQADAVIVATEHSALRDIDPRHIVGSMHSPVVIDQNRFLSASFQGKKDITYITVGSCYAAA
jgi:UDPglucose 6-dehydrogenase